ncbi:MAG: tetratricopeptide repeat protein [Candidatus Coatesbacteria bacterium]|nr:MAG: tetratricopeptide repeat protein [Candidatus Coatesbacteria bacterium]
MVEDRYPLPDEIADDYEEAEGLRLKGAYGDARAIVEGLLERYPEHPKLWNCLGSIYFSEGNYEKAEELFQKTLYFAPHNPKVYNNLSRTYRNLGETEKSAEYARRAIRLEPKSPRSWNTLGLFYVDKGELEIAVDYFIAACYCEEDELEAAFNAACALCQLGETEDALRFLEKSLKHEFFLNYALKDETLDPLRGHPDFERLISEATERFGEP